MVVFPTPPFWLAQAIVWPTQAPGRRVLTSVNSTIWRPFSLSRDGVGAVLPILAVVALRTLIAGVMADADARASVLHVEHPGPRLDSIRPATAMRPLACHGLRRSWHARACERLGFT